MIVRYLGWDAIPKWHFIDIIAKKKTPHGIEMGSTKSLSLARYRL
jgi:hypothetical protein